METATIWFPKDCLANKENRKWWFRRLWRRKRWLRRYYRVWSSSLNFHHSWRYSAFSPQKAISFDTRSNQRSQKYIEPYNWRPIFWSWIYFASLESKKWCISSIRTSRTLWPRLRKRFGDEGKDNPAIWTLRFSNLIRCCSQSSQVSYLE